jgi:hypothetical protein
VLPSPELAGALDAIARARVALVEVAVREPRVDDPSRHVVVALPLQVSRPDDRGAGARAFQEARVRVHLDGRGPRFAIDGAWLSHAPTSATQLDALVREIARAYPRERAVALTMAGNVLHQQLLEVLIGLEGGEPRAFEAVGWLVGAGEPAPAKGTADATLAARTRLHVDPTRAPELVQAFPLARADQSRVEQLARTLGECVPELEATPPRDGVRVDLQFREGRLAELVVGDRVPKARRSALEACARDVRADH